jgi:hypothetical protein
MITQVCRNTQLLCNCGLKDGKWPHLEQTTEQEETEHLVFFSPPGIDRCTGVPSDKPICRAHLPLSSPSLRSRFSRPSRHRPSRHPPPLLCIIFRTMVCLCRSSEKFILSGGMPKLPVFGQFGTGTRTLTTLGPARYRITAPRFGLLWSGARQRR